MVCGNGGITVYFVQYTSLAERDKARTRYLAENIDARQLAPGVDDPTRDKSTSGASSGSYVEFAYTIPSGDHAGQVVAGVWWDNANTPVAGYLLAYWVDGLGASWLPLRDIWQRMS